MITIEQVEKVVKHTGVTYQEAKEALEVTEGNVLEAIINIEKRRGETKQSTHANQNRQEEREQREESNSDSLDQFVEWVKRWVHRGTINKLEVVRNKKVVLALPVLVFIILVLFVFWVTVPLLIISLFFGYGYRFSGPDLEKTKVNDAVQMASEATIKAKDAVVNTFDEWSKKDDDANGKNSNH
ncbi:MAG: DUF4342 domain-containing protein [Erysipelotrichaceae bacterium]